MGFALSQAQFVAVLNATVRGEVEEAKDKLKQESFRLKKEQEKQQGGAIAPEPAAPTDNKEVASKGGASGQ